MAPALLAGWPTDSEVNAIYKLKCKQPGIAMNLIDFNRAVFSSGYKINLALHIKYGFNNFILNVYTVHNYKILNHLYLRHTLRALFNFSLTAILCYLWIKCTYIIYRLMACLFIFEENEQTKEVGKKILCSSETGRYSSGQTVPKEL